ncbi:HpcH/HpaI aldolase/citrate lyase family protein [Amycolatopsis echigonensis]|uniref:Citrate lyase subunit beta/citryl-CoA lyase n=1 Tax=Amycolatopsis echigonensis TaxID=2576905 RepID=A0A2N3WN11_9PSEU|nr:MULTISPECIES: CoA ester lyase [Amycolatopsis]MBB2505905.1 CoA ester lyase [Amycolatopsis echigonensis]PKV95260.1 citrate lyase subunit beta/citryl-CoA lyase [Amycolatopsis niigatensis]
MIPRSWLFCPGERTDRLAKAVAAADVAIADLEDAVAPDRKDAARKAVATALHGDPAAAARTWVRVNHDPADLAALAGLDFAGIVVPKAEPGIVERVAAATSVPLVALIETAAGLWAARELAAHPRVRTLALGEYDLAVELGTCPPDVDGAPLAWARARVVAAAAAEGCPPPPAAVSTVLRDEPRFRADTQQLGRFGFFGRMCIHPAQVSTVHEVLRPSDEEVERATKIVQAAEEATDAVLVVDGKMIDPPVVAHARRVAHLAGPERTRR